MIKKIFNLPTKIFIYILGVLSIGIIMSTMFSNIWWKIFSLGISIIFAIIISSQKTETIKIIITSFLLFFCQSYISLWVESSEPSLFFTALMSGFFIFTITFTLLKEFNFKKYLLLSFIISILFTLLLKILTIYFIIKSWYILIFCCIVMLISVIIINKRGNE